ncbi:MAG: glucose-6-phosphate dehydrogenase [Nannocystaceae bacterium]|nr:glucose-6-phosphate dehydrogenase [Nannocystaceae bacterium]
MGKASSEGSIFTIFGATGDLSRRKLLPALYRSHAAGLIDPRVRILGVSRQDLNDESFRALAAESLSAAGIEGDAVPAFLARLHYFATPSGNPDNFTRLKETLLELGRSRNIPENYCFYLSLPPRVFGPTIAGLGSVGLNVSNEKGWTRVIVEKPFGTDLDTARKLNATIHEHFTEEQIYRIDHYLGKETVQNLLVFRLANAFIESSWNRERVESVQITVGESLGVGSRAGYYDQSGALRDMLQNHITQLIALVAMEVPTSFSADAIRYEKLKVLRSIRPIESSDVIRGRYTAGTIDGEKVKGYLEEDGVPADSETETFLAVKMGIDSWRWQGVPFYIRTGKRMPVKTSQIAVRFRGAPVRYFERLGCSQDIADVLTITLQPNEGFAFHFDIKVPGNPLRLEKVPLRFFYGDHFHGVMPDAYQTLLLDVLEGDQTLFVHGDEVEESWRVYQRLLDAPPPVHDYAAGTWGPQAADALAIPETELWQGTRG